MFILHPLGPYGYITGHPCIKYGFYVVVLWLTLNITYQTVLYTIFTVRKHSIWPILNQMRCIRSEFITEAWVWVNIFLPIQGNRYGSGRSLIKFAHNRVGVLFLGS